VSFLLADGKGAAAAPQHSSTTYTMKFINRCGVARGMQTRGSDHQSNQQI